MNIFQFHLQVPSTFERPFHSFKIKKIVISFVQTKKILLLDKKCLGMTQQDFLSLTSLVSRFWTSPNFFFNWRKFEIRNLHIWKNNKTESILGLLCNTNYRPKKNIFFFWRKCLKINWPAREGSEGMHKTKPLTFWLRTNFMGIACQTLPNDVRVADFADIHKNTTKCVSEWERERERERKRVRECVCVLEWKKERERVCVCLRMKERESVCVCVSQNERVWEKGSEWKREGGGGRLTLFTFYFTL